MGELLNIFLLLVSLSSISLAVSKGNKAINSANEVQEGQINNEDKEGINQAIEKEWTGGGIIIDNEDNPDGLIADDKYEDTEADELQDKEVESIKNDDNENEDDDQDKEDEEENIEKYKNVVNDIMQEVNAKLHQMTNDNKEVNSQDNVIVPEGNNLNDGKLIDADVTFADEQKDPATKGQVVPTNNLDIMGGNVQEDSEGNFDEELEDSATGNEENDYDDDIDGDDYSEGEDQDDGNDENMDELEPELSEFAFNKANPLDVQNAVPEISGSNAMTGDTDEDEFDAYEDMVKNKVENEVKDKKTLQDPWRRITRRRRRRRISGRRRVPVLRRRSSTRRRVPVLRRRSSTRRRVTRFRRRSSTRRRVRVRRRRSSTRRRVPVLRRRSSTRRRVRVLGRRSSTRRRVQFLDDGAIQQEGYHLLDGQPSAELDLADRGVPTNHST